MFDLEENLKAHCYFNFKQAMQIIKCQVILTASNLREYIWQTGLGVLEHIKLDLSEQ